MAIFDHAHPKIIESTFSFPEFVPACKKSVCSISSRLATTICDHAHPKIFDQLLIFVNLYQYAKNQFISSVYSPNTVNLRVPLPD